MTCWKTLQVAQATRPKNLNTVEFKRYFYVDAIFAFSACDPIPMGLGVHCNCNSNVITSKIGLVMMMLSTKSGFFAGGLLALSAWAHAARKEATLG